MEKIDFSKNSLRKFSFVMTLALLVISLIVFLKRDYLAKELILLAGLFLAVGIFKPLLLKPVYYAWMKLACVLCWINTRLILGLLFFLIFTPIGLLLRLFKKDLLERKIDKNQNSYWIKYDDNVDLKVFERQF
ncbi:MAG: SxtJ family membrane protein [Candidatus Gygaella obscura]|nr:SxtJ family membrane protein [Candidatus Gygaella obscura]